MENENNQEQELEQNLEETTDESTEQSGEETVDYKAEAAKYKAIADRKAKQLEKVQAGLSEEETETKPKKTNTEQSALTREEAIFFAKGGNEDDLAVAKKIAELEGIGILAAMEDDFYKSKVAAREAEAQAKANSLGASTGSPSSSGHKTKPIDKMTREEHEAYVKQRIGL